MKILMVCLGNICRSPLAEGVIKEKLASSSIDFSVDSAGTIDKHEGELPDERAIETAKFHGIDITDQRSRPITVEDLDEFDYIFCMDESNYSDVMKMATSATQKDKIHLFLDFAGYKGAEVPDPYFGEMEGFEKVYKMLDNACGIIASKIGE